MGAASGNQNARKKGATRLDVHISVADARRAKLERICRSSDEEALKRACREALYAWIDNTPLTG